MIELYQKNIWNDAKTANIIAGACLAETTKLVGPAVAFFLGKNDKEDEEDENDGPDVLRMTKANVFNKKRKSREKAVERAKATVRKVALKLMTERKSKTTSGKL